ncbi:MAG TPA: methyltransferase domain-containing protein [Solirubrobacteraceae bacterium]|nr:methyltransferase domain-containing protein [Solirubrobacteraceae bacterium]
MSGWQLVDNSAQAYEQYLVPAIFTAFADELVEDVAAGTRVLDVACGTGIVARRAAAREASVVGVDVNEQMLEVARAAGPTIEWIEADAAELPLPDDSFDWVFCQQGLQFFPDPSAALAEMRRVLAPGGHLAVSLWRPCETYEILAGLLDADNAAIMRSPFERTDELCALVGGHVRIAIKPVRFPSAAELLRQEVASSPMSPAVDAALEEAFAAAIRHYTDDDGVVFPMETYVVRAQ